MNMSLKQRIICGIMIAGAFGFLGLGGAHAAPSFCRADQTPAVHVGLIAPTPRSDFSRDMTQLEKFHIDTVNPYGAKIDTHVGGLTAGTIKVEQKMSIAGASLAGQTCLWPGQVQVTIRLDQVVYIAKEYKPGTCMNASVWEHEHKHVRVDREIINKYRPVFETQVRAAAARMGVIGPFDTQNQKAYQDHMMKQIGDAVSVITKQMETERNTRQQNVDTVQEYDRVSAVCKRK